MSQYNITIVETHHAGHHSNYLSAICDAANQVPDTDVNLIATEEVLAVAELDGKTSNIKPIALPSYKNLRNLSLSWSVLNNRRLASVRQKLDDYGVDKTLVFFPTLYDNEFIGFGLSRVFFPFRIGGILMNSSCFRLSGQLSGVYEVTSTPRFLQDSRVNCVAVLDSGICSAVKGFAKHATVDTIPDFATPLSQTNRFDTICEVRERAKKRPIVGLFGYLQRYKGLVILLEAAKRMPDVFFLAAGEIAENDYSTDELQRLRAASNDPSSNFEVIEGKIKSDDEFHEFIRISDAVWCLYYRFVNSSNVFSLAGIYGRYALVPPKGCLADAAEEHPHGVVSNGFEVSDVERAIRAALAKDRNTPISAETIERTRDHFSRDRFCKKLSDLLHATLINN